MNYLDYIILGILFIGFILGYKDGLIRKIIGLIGLIIGIFVAIKFSKQAGILLAPAFNNEFYLSEIIGGITIFLLIIFISSIIKRLVHPADKVNKFLNQFLGGLTGIFQLIIFVSAFLLLLNIFQFPSEKDRDASILYSPVYNIVPKTIDLILGSRSDAKGFIEDYINSSNQSDTLEISDSLNIDSTSKTKDSLQ